MADVRISDLSTAYRYLPGQLLEAYNYSPPRPWQHQNSSGSNASTASAPILSTSHSVGVDDLGMNRVFCQPGAMIKSTATGGAATPFPGTVRTGASSGNFVFETWYPGETLSHTVRIPRLWREATAGQQPRITFEVWIASGGTSSGMTLPINLRLDGWKANTSDSSTIGSTLSSNSANSLSLSKVFTASTYRWDVQSYTATGFATMPMSTGFDYGDLLTVALTYTATGTAPSTSYIVFVGGWFIHSGSYAISTALS